MTYGMHEGRVEGKNVSRERVGGCGVRGGRRESWRVQGLTWNGVLCIGVVWKL